MMRPLLDPRLLALLLVACTAEPKSGSSADPSGSPPVAEPSDPGTLPADPPDAPAVSSAPVTEAEVRPEAEASHRALKRMSVAQVRAVMEQLSGGEPWVDERGNNLWEVYGETLGVADYQTRLRDNLDPSIMFQKFLDDAAVHTCDAWVVKEAAGELGSGRFFTAAGPDDTDPVRVAENLVALRATVHSELSEATDPIVVNYGRLFETALRRTDDPVAAWTTVCVTLFTHPDFFLY